MSTFNLGDPTLQDRIAELFPDDEPLPGGVSALRELRSRADTLPKGEKWKGPKAERARELVKLARTYRRVGMGLVDA